MINTKQAEKEAKRVEPEILRNVHELEQAISTTNSRSETTPGLNKEVVENKKSSKNKIVAIALQFKKPSPVWNSYRYLRGNLIWLPIE